MPTRPWKKAIVPDGLLSGFRSNRTGSLVVQTGFPTSLADLIVKNHVRLKKASRTSKKASPTPDLFTTGGGGGAATRFPALGCHLRDTEIGSAEPPGPRFRLLAGTLIILSALLIGKKKLVLWITVSAFSLLLLEFCGRFLKPCLEARKKFDSLIGSFEPDLIGRESASPIKQTRLGFLAGSSVSDRKPPESRILDQSSHEDDCRKGKSKLSGKCDAKKLLRKFMLSKTHGIREDGRVPHCDEAMEEELSEKNSSGNGEEVDDAEDEDQSFKTSYGELGDGDGNKLHKCFQFVLFLIVLCGLMRGKGVALGLALAWCFLFRFIRVMREGKVT
ncbi:hypothetical protein KSP39_PZI021266 [Platanthera zijinensis]|uniref:Uncharacterized protein n=1 Tax=Platanthera zijinensis TaxID=2320716 RepID=A0AAP0AXB3_9ASPA